MYILSESKTLSLTDNTIKGFLWMFSGKGFQAIFQFIVTVVLARLLTPNDFGVVSAATVVITFTSIFSMVGVGPALVQRPKLTEYHIRTAYVITIFLSLFFSILMYVSSNAIASFFNIIEMQKVLKIMSIIFILKGFSIVSESLMQRDLRFKLFASIEVVSYLAYAIVGISSAFLGYDYWSLVFAQIFQSLVKTILLITTQKHSKRLMFHKESAKELLFFGGGYTLARISNQFALQADNLVVGKWLGPSALGLYTRAYQLMVMPSNLFGQVMDKVLFPVMAQIQDDRKQLSHSFKVGITAVAFFTIPSGILICLLSKEIVIVLFGEKWVSLVPALQVLSLGLVFRTGYKISDSLARATGAVYKRALRQVVYAIGVFFGAWIGQYWGLEGVAIGVLFAIFINYSLMTHLSMQFIDLKFKDIIKAHVPGLILGLLSIASVLFVKLLTNLIYLHPIFIILFSSLLFLFIVLVLFKFNVEKILGHEVNWIKNRVLQIILKR